MVGATESDWDYFWNVKALGVFVFDFGVAFQRSLKKYTGFEENVSHFVNVL